MHLRPVVRLCVPRISSVGVTSRVTLPVARSLDSAAPLKQLPDLVDFEPHRVRRHPRARGLVNEYRLVA